MSLTESLVRSVELTFCYEINISILFDKITAYFLLKDTLEPHTTRPDTTRFFLGSQMIFKKYMWSSEDLNSSILAYITIKMLYLYKYGRILTKIFSLVEESRRGERFYI